MKKICFFCGNISESGGTEKVLSTLTNGLVLEKKIKIFILSRIQSKNETFYTFSDKIKINYLKKENDKMGKLSAIKDIYKIRKFIKKNNIDIIVDVDLILDIYTIPACLFLKTKIISWEHFNFEIENTSFRRRFAMKLATLFSDKIVTLTRYDTIEYQKNFKKLKKIECISNPVEDMNFPKCNINNKQIISVGKFLPVKGYDLLIEIAKIVFAKHKDWKWVILGDGPERKKIETLAKKYKIDKQLLFIGNVKNVKKYYAKSSIFVLPSKSEGFGLVVLEAKLSQLPVICFDIKHGIDDLITNNENGIKIEKYDIEKFADKINELIENDTLRKKLSSNSEIDFENYKLNVIVKKWYDLFDRVV